MEEFTASVKIELNGDDGVLEMHGNRGVTMQMLWYAAAQALTDLPIPSARNHVITFQDMLKEYIQKRQEQEETNRRGISE